MFIKLPLDMSQKVYVIADKVEKNSTGKVYTTNVKTIYPATNLGISFKSEDDKTVIKVKVLVQTHVELSPDYFYLYISEVEDSVCYSDEADAINALHTLQNTRM